MKYRPANDVRDRSTEALALSDMANEIGLKRAENRIVQAKGYAGAGARWMLRRLRWRLFGGGPGK